MWNRVSRWVGDEPLKQTSPSYQLFMLVLCVFSLTVLLLEAIFSSGHPEIARVLDYGDDFVCAIFLADFFYSLHRAPRKWRYLMTWGWLDLLSSIPTLDVARWGRLARIARLMRVLRAFRAARFLGTLLVQHRGQSAVLAAALLALFLIVASSAAIIRFEDLPESNIRTADDAIWWAFTTITTVGYGDRFPVSGEGRVIAVVLMSAGVGLFSAFSAALAAWFLAPEEQNTNEEVAALTAEVAQLRKLLEERL